MIDLVTNYCQLIQIDNKSAAHVGQKFENEWLSWYPHPQSCIYDQGNEFLGFRFQQHLHRYNIHSKVSTVKNPQSNAVAEHLHQTVTNILRSTLYANPPDNQMEAELLIDTGRLCNARYSPHNPEGYSWFFGVPERHDTQHPGCGRFTRYYVMEAATHR